MHLLKLQFHPFDRWDEGRPSGAKTTPPPNFVNPAFIVSIEPYKGSMLHEGLNGSKVRVEGGNSYLDARTPEQLTADIEKLTKAEA